MYVCECACVYLYVYVCTVALRLYYEMINNNIVTIDDNHVIDR